MRSAHTRSLNATFLRRFSIALRTCGFILIGLLACGNGYSQTPLPSPSPAPTPITKTGSILVNSPSTVGRITRWVGSSSNGIGTIGDSVMTESSLGTIGIGTNPFNDFKLAIDGGGIGGLFGRSSGSGTGVFGSSSGGIGLSGFSNGGTGVFGQTNTGWAGFFQGRVNVTGLFSTGNLLLNPGGTLQFADGTIQSTAFTGQINQSQVINLIPTLASKANDSGVVHLSGTETITGAKTFSGFQLFSGNVGMGMHGPTTDTLLNVGGNTGVVAGTFINNHNTSENDALFAVHTGRGNAFHALNTQVIGRAGFFENSHTNSTSPVLEALGHGPGPAFKSSNTGTGPAAIFTSGKVGIGTAAPQARLHVSNVGGTAGQFDGNVTIDGNLTLTGSSNISPNVNHDSTLTGNGSSISPLSVVSVPNGVVTTGNYANPSWITSLDGSKVTGAVSNATTSTNAAIADTVKVPLALTGTNNILSLTGGGGVPTLIINNTETGGGAGIQSTIDGVGNAILAYNNGNGAALHAESFGGEPTIKGISKTANGGAGVYGLSSIASGIGVFGENNGNGAGVYGRSHGSGNALEGHSLAPSGKGIYAVNHAGGTAGLFDGNVTINGGLNVTSIKAANLSSVGTINTASNPVDWSALKNVPSSIASGQVVNSVNGLFNNVSLVAGNNVSITPTGNTLTIASTFSGSNFVAKTGDTMTGTLNLPANGLVTGGNQFVLSGGNVGIGTATPAFKLDVAGSMRTNSIDLPTGKINALAGSLRLQGTTTQQGTTGGFLDLGPGNAYYPGGTVTLGAGTNSPQYGSGQGPYIKLFGNDYFDGGDILIASGHSYGHDVNGQGTGGTITLATSTAYGGNYPPPGPIVFKIGGSERFRVNGNGNVGIGTDTPGAPLEVRGVGAGPTFRVVNSNNNLAGQFDGNVTINGNLTVSGTSSGFAIADGAVTTSKLADNAVVANKIANSAVTESKLADTAVTGPKIAAGQVVKSLNSLTDSVTLVAGDNVTITPSGNALTISAAGTGSAAPSGALRVVDSLGAEVGVWFGQYGDLEILRFLPIDDVWLHLNVRGNGDLYSNSGKSDRTLFETTDCTGIEYTYRNTPGGFYEYASVSEGIVYYPEQVPPSRINLQSRLEYGVCRSWPYPADVVRWKSFPISDLGLMAPFKLSR